MLTDLQIVRYSRQIILPAVGGRGQQQLLSAAVAVAGETEMARVAALYLAAAGIGRLIVMGAERGAYDDLKTLNPDCHVTQVGWHMAGEDAAEIVRQADAVVSADACDDTVTLLNTQCLAWCRPLIFGRVTGTCGEVTLLAGRQPGGPCYECLSQHVARVSPEWSAAEPNLAAGASVRAALSGAVGGFIGSLLATEVIKLTLDLGPMPAGRRLTYDALSARMSVMDIPPAPSCAACGIADATSARGGEK